MGFRFRKSFGKGPFRVTVSKSGVGYSVGGKGFRVTKKAGGGIRTTASIPGTGISYVKDYSDKKKPSNSKTTSPATASAQQKIAVQKTSTKRNWKKGFGIFCIFGAIVMLINGNIFATIVYAAIAALLLLAPKFKQEKKGFQVATPGTTPIFDDRPIKNTDQASQSAVSSVKDSSIGFINQESPLSASFEVTKEEALRPKVVPASEIKSFTAKATGMQYYMDNIHKLATENPDYDLSKKEIIENGLTDEKIWKYEYYCTKAELIPDPENPYDKNAIKVVVDGLQVGHIKANSCVKILNKMKAGKIRGIDCEIGGGPYKIVYEDYDDDTYTLERNTINHFVHLTIYESAADK